MLEGENEKSQSIISKGQVYWVPYGYFGENIESHIEKMIIYISSLMVAQPNNY
jgi:agmatine/peptidylarginine deiminase